MSPEQKGLLARQLRDLGESAKLTHAATGGGRSEGGWRDQGAMRRLALSGRVGKRRDGRRSIRRVAPDRCGLLPIAEMSQQLYLKDQGRRARHQQQVSAIFVARNKNGSDSKAPSAALVSYLP